MTNISSAALAAILYGSTNATTSGAPSMAAALDAEDAQKNSTANTTTNTTPSDAITLSAKAQAYIAKNGTVVPDPQSLSDLTTDARQWFNDQYKSLGISSALVDGKTAVDFTGQSRDTLSVIANNTNGAFSDDEVKAASDELTARFNKAMAPYLVIAQHTGDYSGLYQAASDYLDKADANERATSDWQAQKQAVLDGLAAAKKTSGAPKTFDKNDPIGTLINPPDDDSATPTSTSLAGSARSMLDKQEAAATKNKSHLSFVPSDKSGTAVDFSDFDNRTLATMVLNAGDQFSQQEIYAAKTELNARTRLSMLSALGNTSDGSSATASFNLIQQYSGMSAEEKKVLGVTDDVTSRLVQSYKTMLSVQNTLSAGGFGVSSGGYF